MDKIKYLVFLDPNVRGNDLAANIIPSVFVGEILATEHAKELAKKHFGAKVYIAQVTTCVTASMQETHYSILPL